MFSNAKNVEINGKEVKSIILENGAILYEKEYPYILSVSSNKDILSYADWDSATLTARLTKGGVPIEGETVKFYVEEEAEGHLLFTGQEFRVRSDSVGFLGTNIVIDWGDGTTTNYVSRSSLNHTYATNGDYAITLNGNITSLGTYCFIDCPGLTSIVIPDSVTSIGNNCFRNCSSLTSIVIPDSVTSIGTACFSLCSSLTSIVIPDSVTSIGNNCFSLCSSLTSIVIPDSVTSLGTYCFIECSNLTSIVFNWTDNIPTYTSSWFTNTPLPSMSIPNGTRQAYIDAGYPSNKLIERED